MVDFVNHPPHYTAYEGLEIIDLTEQMNFNRGNAVKYVARAGLKGEGLMQEIQDLEKAVWYIQREIQRLSKPKAMCLTCGNTKSNSDAIFCGGCGNCLEHCACNTWVTAEKDPEPASFNSNITFEESGDTHKDYICPHWLKPSQEHLDYRCAEHRQMVLFDVKKFDTGDAHFIANHTVHMNMDDVADIVRAAKEQGGVVVEFLLSTHEVSPLAKKASFCPHSQRPTFIHLQDSCQRSQARMEYDLERFDTGDAHFIARRNVHLTMDEVVDEVRKMLDVGSKIGSFAVSTYEVVDAG